MLWCIAASHERRQVTAVRHASLRLPHAETQPYATTWQCLLKYPAEATCPLLKSTSLQAQQSNGGKPGVYAHRRGRLPRGGSRPGSSACPATTTTSRTAKQLRTLWRAAASATGCVHADARLMVAVDAMERCCKHFPETRGMGLCQMVLTQQIQRVFLRNAALDCTSGVPCAGNLRAKGLTCRAVARLT